MIQQVNFVAHCPIDIGDTVTLSNQHRKYKVEDILTVHSLKTGEVEFKLVCNAEEGWVAEYPVDIATKVEKCFELD